MKRLLPWLWYALLGVAGGLIGGALVIWLLF